MVRAQGRQTLCEQGKMMGSRKREPQTGHFSSSSIAAAALCPDGGSREDGSDQHEGGKLRSGFSLLLPPPFRPIFHRAALLCFQWRIDRRGKGGGPGNLCGPLRGQRVPRHLLGAARWVGAAQQVKAGCRREWPKKKKNTQPLSARLLGRPLDGSKKVGRKLHFFAVL